MKLYLKYFAMHLNSQMQYKVSFALTMLGQILTSFTAFLGVWFMFTRFSQVENFTFSEVLLAFATVLLAFSLAARIVTVPVASSVQQKGRVFDPRCSFSLFSYFKSSFFYVQTSLGITCT